MRFPEAEQQDESTPLLQQQGGVAESSPNRPLTKANGHQNDNLLHDSLYPKDVFKGTTYWADLPSKEQRQWIGEQLRDQRKQEFSNIREMMRVGIFEPVRVYFHDYASSGLGLFIEGYVLFFVGNVMPLFKSIWPECWDNHTLCSPVAVSAVKYMEIAGIICGQFMIGYLADHIGRRWGLIQDALIMLLGTLMLTSMWGVTLEAWTIMYCVSIFIFGLGVGGEYPMTSTSSVEGRKGREDRAHRGRAVSLAFLMQGWGQLANQLVLMVLLVVFSQHHKLAPPYTERTVQLVFRFNMLIAAVFIGGLLYQRTRRPKHTKSKSEQGSKQNDTSKSGKKDLKFMLRHFWPRLLASSLCWFCSDFAFYGNQVFRNQLLELVTDTPATEVNMVWLYNLVNIGCQLCGYYLTAMLVDHKSWGRKRIQMQGFGAMFVLFTVVAGGFSSLNQSGTPAKIFQAIYFVTNFFVQFGPNSTTFLIAAEIFPDGVRSTAHGFSAAVGKTGALAATVSYNYIDDRHKFVLCSVFSLIGLILTVVFVPDTTALDLAEMQRAWAHVVEGTFEDYHGIAIHPRHLSLYEKRRSKRDRAFDMDLDRAQRVGELRKAYQSRNGCLDTENGEDDEVSARLKRYFESEGS